MTRATSWHRTELPHTMKPVLAAAFAAITLFCLTPAAGADALQQNQRLGRGVNIIGWDALWQDRARGPNSVTLTIEPRRGSYEHMPSQRDYEICMPIRLTDNFCVPGSA